MSGDMEDAAFRGSRGQRWQELASGRSGSGYSILRHSPVCQTAPRQGGQPRWRILSIVRTATGAPERHPRRVRVWTLGFAAGAIILATLPASATGNSFDTGATSRFVDAPGSADASVELAPGVLSASSSLTSPMLPSALHLLADQSRDARADATGFVTLRDQLQAGHRYRVVVRLDVPTTGLEAPTVQAIDGPLSLGLDPDRRDSWAIVYIKTVFRGASDGVSIRRDLACTGDVADFGPCENPGAVEIQYDLTIRPQDDAFIDVSVQLTAFSTLTPFGSSASASAVARLVSVTAAPIN